MICVVSWRKRYTEKYEVKEIELYNPEYIEY